MERINIKKLEELETLEDVFRYINYGTSSLFKFILLSNNEISLFEEFQGIYLGGIKIDSETSKIIVDLFKTGNYENRLIALNILKSKIKNECQCREDD